MYSLTLLVHSWLRWAVLLAALWALTRALSGRRNKRAWDAGDDRAHTVLKNLADVQFLLGLLLYLWLSPLVRSAFSDMGAAMRSAPLRFFAIEHITAMVIAVGVLHVGHARVRKQEPTVARQRSAFRWTLAFLLLVLSGIPWPSLKQGRPLLRTSISSSELPRERQAPEVYIKRCAVCHGATGAGDGAAAAAMQPKPRVLSDSQWQQSISDEQLRLVIQQGGSARQLSTNMPAHPDLGDQQLGELVRFIRSLSKSTVAPR